MAGPRLNQVFSAIEEKLAGALQRLGIRFEREYSIGPYFADFYFPGDKLVVECDGKEWHKDKDYDERRDKYMKKRGYQVRRFTGSEIMKDPLETACRVACRLGGSYPQHEKYLQIKHEAMEAQAKYEEDVFEGRVDPPDGQYIY